MAAKKQENVCMTCGPNTCSTCGLIILVVGILFLLKDLAVITLWGIQPWTVVFLLIGLFAVLGACRRR